ncbi:MAG: chromate efflux transporter [Opitutaceae bacterium]|nr:chromate efflux transporter [Opitutaceae bacterium]
MNTGPSTAVKARPHRVREIAAVFLKLGCISFGGPVAHLGYLREELVARRRWLDDAAYSDLVALCQFLPGPASSQVVFGLGMSRGGLLGAAVASACFTLPSALLMILFAYGVTFMGDLREAGWLHGLKLAAVAVVAQAVWGMGVKLCPDRARASLALAAAAVLLVVPTAIVQVGVIAAGALIGWAIYRREVPINGPAATGLVRGHLVAAAALVACFALLIILPAVATATGSRGVQVFDSFYRSGSLVFGGGHVILPLLRAEVVPPGWVADDAFLAGYGAAQAVPGPLFTLAAYLGTVIHGGPDAWLGGVACLAAIFLPAWLLVGGALPFWHLLRGKAWTQAALRGANAAVVGVLLAALYNPVWKEGVRSAADVAVALAVFALLETWRLPAWLVVVVAAAAGQWLL